MTQKVSSGLLVFIFLFSLSAIKTRAQNNYDIQFSMLEVPLLRMDFIPVSARPAAMGGAFIGAAQDESSAPINPAGMTYMQSRVAGLSLNQHWSQTEYQPPGFQINSVQAPAFKANRFDQSMVGGFIPFKHFSIAIYRQVVLDANLAFKTQPVAAPTPLQSDNNYEGRIVNLDYRLISDAVSMGFRLNRRLRVGISLKLTGLKMNLDERIFSPDKPENTADNLNATVDVARRSNEPNFSAGIMADLYRSKLFAGAVYHYYPRYQLETDIFFPTRISSENVRNPELLENVKFDLGIPDIYGAGLYFLPSESWSFTFDIIRIMYSEMATAISIPTTEQSIMPAQANQQSDFKPEDATEFHFGIEYIPPVPDLGFLPLQTVFLRTGFYSDPGQKWLSNGQKNPIYPEVESGIRYSLGLGLQITNHFKIDIASVATKNRIEVIASALISVAF
jgi:long-subunit fatty acid transport protein